MSDQPDQPNPPLPLPLPNETADPEPAPRAAPAEPPAARLSLVALVALILALVEAVAIAVLWIHPNLPPSLSDRLSGLDDEARSASSQAVNAAAAASAVTGRFNAMAASLAELQKRPPPPFNPHPLEAEIAVLKLGLAQAAAMANGAAAQALGAQKLARSTSDDLHGSAASAQAANAALSARLQTTQSSADALDTRIQTVAANLDTLAARVDREGAQGREVASLAGSAERLARLQAAAVALSIGRPTGPIPNAPPALARFADRSPPTEASLILAFPDVASATLRASEPDTGGQNFFRRIWTRAQSALTIRDGTRVLVGDPAAGIVAGARERLAAGDLAGAVSVLGALSGSAADAMDPWRSKAAALVDARAALASMMARQ